MLTSGAECGAIAKNILRKEVVAQLGFDGGICPVSKAFGEFRGQTLMFLRE